MEFESCNSRHPLKWTIRRERVVEDFHHCIQVYLSATDDEIFYDLKNIQFSIHEEDGIGAGADRSILNHYFDEMRKNKRLFELNDAKGIMPRRLLQRVDLQEMENFGSMVILAWKRHSLVPLGFHPYITIFACCYHNEESIEKYISRQSTSDLEHAIQIGGISFPKCVEDWYSDGSKIPGALAQCLRETYSLDHIMDSDLESNHVSNHYQHFYTQAMKHILFRFRFLSFLHIGMGAHRMEDEEADLLAVLNQVARAHKNVSFEKIPFNLVLQTINFETVVIRFTSGSTSIFEASMDTPYSAPEQNTTQARSSTRNIPYNLRSRRTPAVSVTNTIEPPSQPRMNMTGVLTKYLLFIRAGILLQNQDPQFTRKFLNFVTSCEFIQDPIAIHYTNVKRLPQSRTCMNHLILWEGYKNPEELKQDLLLAIEMSGDFVLNH